MSDLIPCYQGEVQLLNWSETHNGGAKIVLQLSDPRDLEKFKLMTIKKGNVAGQRMAAVFVEIGEDEMPVQDKPRTSREAAFLCKSPRFQQYVARITHVSFDSGEQSENQAKQYIYGRCNIGSRAELDSNTAAYKLYTYLLMEYHDYAAQHFGGEV